MIQQSQEGEGRGAVTAIIIIDAALSLSLEVTIIYTYSGVSLRKARRESMFRGCAFPRAEQKALSSRTSSSQELRGIRETMLPLARRWMREGV